MQGPEEEEKMPAPLETTMINTKGPGSENIIGNAEDYEQEMLAMGSLSLGGKMQTRQGFKDDVFVNAGVKATRGL